MISPARLSKRSHQYLSSEERIQHRNRGGGGRNRPQWELEGKKYEQQLGRREALSHPDGTEVGGRSYVKEKKSRKQWKAISKGGASLGGLKILCHGAGKRRTGLKRRGE